MPEVALGIDIGTGSTKVGLVDGAGRLLAVGRHPHPPIEPRPGWSEADPARWLEAVGHAVAQALGSAEAAELDPTVVAIGFSGQMHGVVVCDADAVPLRPAVLWSDRRSEPDLAGLGDRLGPGLLARLANPVVAGMAGSTLAALRRLEPDLVERAELVLQPKDWVRARLTGVVATEATDASATLLWDVPGDRWSVDAAEVFGVERRWLATVTGPGEAAGSLRGDWAERLGLPAEVPVAAGAADTAAALLGAGLSVGETQLSTGTGGQLARLIDEPMVDPTGRTHLYRAVGDRWYAMAAIQNAGIAIDWAVGVLGADEAEVEAAMSLARSTRTARLAEEVVTFLPYLTGERTPHLDASLTGRWVGLRPGTSRAALIRSVFEGVALALRDALDALRAAGHPIETALLAGGGSVAPWWRQLLADTLDLPLVPHDATDASVRGAGLLGWAAIGVEIDPGAGVHRAEAVTPTAVGVEAMVAARQRFLAAGPAPAGLPVAPE